eukprot:2399983-Amphidinium_carterae.1
MLQNCSKKQTQIIRGPLADHKRFSQGHKRAIYVEKKPQNRIEIKILIIRGPSVDHKRLW